MELPMKLHRKSRHLNPVAAVVAGKPQTAFVNVVEAEFVPAEDGSLHGSLTLRFMGDEGEAFDKAYNEGDTVPFSTPAIEPEAKSEGKE